MGRTRIRALELAIKYHRERKFAPDEVAYTAEIFYNFLLGRGEA